MDELYDRGYRTIMEEARKIVGDGHTYISFDVDGLDPVYTPGTGTPEVFILTGQNYMETVLVWKIKTTIFTGIL